MDWNRIVLSVFFVLLTIPVLAQRQRCGTNKVMEERMEQFPSFHKQVEKLNAAILSATQNGPSRGNGLINIPVVIHVLWNTPVQNIEDAQIFSQIDILNADFRRLNADSALTRELFKPFAADTRIEFCLAQRDPQGNPTNGINRVQTSVTAFGADDAMKFSALGGADAWPADQYLNIWVCNNWEVWGYAYFPGIEPEYDGVVCHYEAFGDTLQVVPPFDKGRTCTHEIGHWLGLYHTFDFGCTGQTQQTCLGAGDRVCDTPGDATESYSCNFNLNTCVDSPVDFPDMVENFMDYSEDACLNMFTAGQAERMRLALETFRIPLLYSNACVPVGGAFTDVVALRLVAPVNGRCNPDPELIFEIGNAGNTTITDLDLHLYEGDDLNTSITWTGVLLPNNTTEINMPVTNLAYGSNNLKLILSDPNGNADQNSLNDTLVNSLEIVDLSAGALPPFGEGFEAGLLPPENWFVNNPDQDYYWDLSSFYGAYLSSSNSMIFENYWVGEEAIGRLDQLISPIFSFETVLDPNLSFDLAYPDPGSDFYSDTLSLYWSSDCGENWSLLWQQGGVELASAPTPFGFNNFEPDNSDDWRTVEIDLSILGGLPAVQFQWENKSGWGYDLYLDNINVEGEVVLSDEEAPVFDQVQIYPNPTTGKIIISGLDEEGVLSVFSADGKVLRQFETNQARNFDLAGLPMGLLFINLLTESHQKQFRVILFK
ncbi:MAG: choice-of-anchor J domain-containing protein [Saprospiraceae bacterium]|nr:choice-of-anchor J domain-containing protein [Saprospiraceae bacterium]